MPPAVSTTGWTRVDVALRPDELVAAWRPESNRLVLAVPRPMRLQERVVSRIMVIGLDVAATITGRVASASRQGNLHRVELAPDELRRPALAKLLSVARGEPIEYQNRLPRFLVSLPAVVQGANGTHYRTTFSVSAKGCGLAWSGPVPAIGDPVDVRLGAGNRAAKFQAVVCWTAQAGNSTTVGVRFVAGHMGVWASILNEVEGSGAPPA